MRPVLNRHASRALSVFALFLACSALIFSGCESSGGGKKKRGAVLAVWEGSVGNVSITDMAMAADGRDFGDQALGSSSSALTITLQNAGGAPLDLIMVDVTATDSAAFTLDVTNFTSGALDPAMETSFDLVFAPTTIGAKSASVEISYEIATMPFTFTFDLAGNAIGPTLEVYEGDSATGTLLTHDDAAADGRDFGTALVGSGAGSAQIFTVRNNGNADLTLMTPALGGADVGDFVLDASNFTTTLPAASETSFSVAFDPMSLGTRSATISLDHNDTAASNPFTINLQGEGSGVLDVREGAASGLQILSGSPAADGRAFGQQDIFAGGTSALTIVVVNRGNVSINVDPPMLVGTDASEFVLTSTGFNGSLNSGMETSFSITFDPATVGMLEAEVELTHNAPGSVPSPFVIHLSGEGTSTLPGLELYEDSLQGQLLGDLAISALAIDMGSVPIGTTGTTTYVIHNNGGVDLMLTAPMLSGSNNLFSLDTTNFSTTVAAGASTSFDLLFSPLVLGAQMDTISLGHNLPGTATPTTINVDALGDEAPTMTVTSPDLMSPVMNGDMGVNAVDLGTGKIGTPSIALTLTITNTAPAQDLHVDQPMLSGPDAGNFIITPNWMNQAKVAPMGTIEIQLAFNSNMPQSLRATLSFDHDALGVGGPTFSFEIIATASLPSAFAWGEGDSGQLGNGTTDDKNQPTLVAATEALGSMSGGKDFVLSVTTVSNVMAWGNNSRGQLGDGTNTLRTRPVAVVSLIDITDVAAGEDFGLALDSSGSVWAWGANDVGQLGDASGMDRNIPAQINGLSNISAIAAGESHAMALDSSGRVWVWGSNSHGQLGLGHTQDQLTPVQIPRVNNATSISCGLLHSHYVDNQGDAYGFGSNSAGQIGNGSAGGMQTSPVRVINNSVTFVQLDGGAEHTIAVVQDGANLRVLAWGANDKGQLGTGSGRPSSIPVEVSTGRAPLELIVQIQVYADVCVAYKLDDFSMWTWGDERAHAGVQQNVAVQRTGVPMELTRVAAGDGFALAAE